MLLLRSLNSKNFVEVVFNWLSDSLFPFSNCTTRHYYYYFVKTEGVKYLRGYLGIPEEVVPITHKKVKKNYTGIEEREGTVLH